MTRVNCVLEKKIWRRSLAWWGSGPRPLGLWSAAGSARYRGAMGVFERSILLVLAVSACGSSAFRQLSQPEKDLFFRCDRQLMNAQCASGGDWAYQNVCISGLQDGYAKATDREEWLLANGCPPAMVNPRAVTQANRQAAPTAAAPRAVPFQVAPDSPFRVLSTRAVDRDHGCEVVADFEMTASARTSFVSAVAADAAGASLAMDRGVLAEAVPGTRRTVEFRFRDLSCRAFYGVRFQP